MELDLDNEFTEMTEEYNRRARLSAATILELSRQVRRLTKELKESRKVVDMRREQVNNLKKANKSLRTSNHFYIEREKDNQGNC